MPTEIYSLLTTMGIEEHALSVLGQYWTLIVLFLWIAGAWFVFLAAQMVYYSFRYNDMRMRQGFQWRWLAGTIMNHFPQALAAVLSFVYT